METVDEDDGREEEEDDWKGIGVDWNRNGDRTGKEYMVVVDRVG